MEFTFWEKIYFDSISESYNFKTSTPQICPKFLDNWITQCILFCQLCLIKELAWYSKTLKINNNILRRSLRNFRSSRRWATLYNSVLTNVTYVFFVEFVYFTLWSLTLTDTIGSNSRSKVFDQYWMCKYLKLMQYVDLISTTVNNLTKLLEIK